MSQEDIAWNAFYDKYGKEPESSYQLYQFVNENDKLQDISQQDATDTFNKNKGNGYIKHVKVPSNVDIVYHDLEIAHAVSSDIGEEDDNEEKKRKESSVVSPSMDTPIPSQPPKAQMLPTTSEEQFDVTAFDFSGNPSSKDQNGEDTNRNRSESDKRSHSVIQSLQTEVRDNTVNSRMHKLGSKSGCLVLGFSIFVLIMVIIILPILNGTLNSKMDEHQQAFNAALAGKLHYEAVHAMDEAQTIYVGNYYGWSYALYRDAAYRKTGADSQSLICFFSIFYLCFSVFVFDFLVHQSVMKLNYV